MRLQVLDYWATVLLDYWLGTHSRRDYSASFRQEQEASPKDSRERSLWVCSLHAGWLAGWLVGHSDQLASCWACLQLLQFNYSC